MSHAKGTLRLAAASMERARATQGDAQGLALVMAVLALLCDEPRKRLPMDHRRAEAKASRERWEALMTQAKEERVKR